MLLLIPRPWGWVFYKGPDGQGTSSLSSPPDRGVTDD
jgi:hypothetical protein